MKNLNPIHFFKFLIKFSKELSVYRYYRKTVKTLEDSGELEREGLRVDRLKRIYFIKNLAPETLLYGANEEGGIERFEKTFVAEELKLHNNLFIKNQLIDIVKTSLERIKTADYYAYLVLINFRFRLVTTWKSIYIILYLSGLTYLISIFITHHNDIIEYIKGLYN